MVRSSRILGAHIIIINFWLLLGVSITSGTDTDIFCLKSMKDSLEDPHGYLKSWDFNNNTEGFICRFTGVECWHPDENRVLNLKMSNMGLKGQFPRAIRNCSSLIGLDLSKNELSGTIPADINVLLKFMTTLDLSANYFSWQIPEGLANCTYLNSLKLDQNQLTGQIPGQFSLLSRLKVFTVSNNHLTGQVPNLQITAESYANNRGLCGGPLPPCEAKANNQAVVIAGAAVGGVTVAALVLGIGLFFYVRRVSADRKNEEPQGNQ